MDIWQSPDQRTRDNDSIIESPGESPTEILYLLYHCQTFLNDKTKFCGAEKRG